MSRKIVSVSVDGATFDVIDPLIEKGLLPNFKRMMSYGNHNRLKSSLPYHSACAFTSAYTGLNPGEHGVLSFYRANPSNYKEEPIFSYDIRYPMAWDMLNQHGKKSVVLQIPISQPTHKINGAMVAWNCTFPESLRDEIKKELGCAAYTSLQRKDIGLDNYYENIYENFNNHLKIMHHLIDNQEWDALFVNLIIVDHVCHYFWHGWDKEHPANVVPLPDEYQNAVVQAYIDADNAIGDLLDKVGDAAIFLFSDHGFRRAAGVIAINGILRNAGLLSIVEKSHEETKKVVAHDMGAEMAVDFGQTAAYLTNLDMGNTITINLVGRQRLGTVRMNEQYEDVVTMVEKLMRQIKVVDHQLCDNVHRKSEIWHGDYVDGMPDLYLETPFRLINRAQELDDIAFAVKGATKTKRQAVFNTTGVHERHGIYMSNTKQKVDHIQGIFGAILNEASIEPQKMLRILTEPRQTTTEADKINEQLKGLGYVE